MDEYVTPGGITLPERALSWRFAKSGGPGGQHVNTSDSKATVILDVTRLDVEDDVRDRLLEVLGEEATATASKERSQLMNRQAALEVLSQQIDQALVKQKVRKPNKIPRGVNEARLRAKKARSQRKADRRWDG